MTQPQADAKPAQLELLIRTSDQIFSRYSYSNDNMLRLEKQPKPIGLPQRVSIPANTFKNGHGESLLTMMQACESAAKRIFANFDVMPNAYRFLGHAEDGDHGLVLPVQYYLIKE